MRWGELEAAAPDVAMVARTLIERPGFMYVGTVRSDGAPRISPVEAHLVEGHLMLVMIARSRKARDLERDPRVTLQSPVTDPADPGTELKLRGRVAEVDEAQRADTTRAIEAASGWRPQPSWRFFSVDVDSVAVLDWVQGELTLTVWDAERGVRPPERFRLDTERSAYRRIS
jgi:hypothetical protein